MRPVIQRELRVASRRSQTWQVRVVFGVGAMVALAFGLALPDVPARERGQSLLMCLGVCGLVLCLFSGTYLTADAISLEKRGGTLGLLFLTPLKGWQIVLGKAAIHSMQVGYALLGAFPILFIPLLMGGVGWAEVTRILLVLMASLLLSLAVGMFWSTIAFQAQTAVLASAVSMILITLLPWLEPFLEGLLTQRFGSMIGPPQISPMTSMVFAFEANYRMQGGSVGPGNSGAFVYWGSLVLIAGSGAVLLVISGWMLPWLWRRSEAGGRAGMSVPRACRPRLRAMAEARLSATRDRAPLEWLFQRRLGESIWLRLVRGAGFCFFVIMLVTSVTTRHWREGFIGAFCAAYALHLVTRIQLAVSATGSLVEDRRNGALETLLVTPVTNGDVVDAHHRALKRAFRRPLWLLLGMNGALQLCVVAFHEHLHMDHGAGAVFSVGFIGGALVTLSDFAALRWLCLRESLRSATPLKAAGMSLVRLNAVAWAALGVVIPVAMGFNDEEVVAVIFSLWILLCLFVNTVSCRSSRRWLRAGLRGRVSEGR